MQKFILVPKNGAPFMYVITLVLTKATIGSISAITNLFALINGKRPEKHNN